MLMTLASPRTKLHQPENQEDYNESDLEHEADDAQECLHVGEGRDEAIIK